MGFYEKHVFPRIMDLSTGSRKIREERKKTLAPAFGDVLEIGFGTGRHLPYYPEAVTSLTAVDPAIMIPKRVGRRIAEARMPVEVVHLGAEGLPLEDGRFDCVVSTLTLCTIPDVMAALKEVARMLKPGGNFLFLEHGRSDDPTVAKWQDRLNPLNRRIGCGCNMNRSIDALIREAGLRFRAFDRYALKGVPRVFMTMYRGVATPG